MKEYVVAVDVSGGISNKMLQHYISTIHKIFSKKRNFKLHLWAFDAQILQQDTCTGKTLYKIDEFFERCPGGGGTLLSCVYNKMTESGLVPHQLLVFSDGYIFDYEKCDADYCTTLFYFFSHRDGYSLNTQVPEQYSNAKTLRIEFD